jgi:Cu-processing system ATP-binding protein
MFDCPVYILDEPTTGLDPIALIRLKDLILEMKKKGKTFLITTHIMTLVEELADELIFLLEGHVYFRGTYSKMMEEQNENNLERAIAKILERENAKNS